MHVITQHCCNDAACVDACPVDCIHPRPDEPGYATAEMLYIDPDTCIDCGACVAMCPVDAIRTADDLGEAYFRYPELNAFYAAENLDTQSRRPPATPVPVRLDERLRVAIVGAGPAGLYAAEQLLTTHGVDVEVDVFDRLLTPWGLIRAGVAPDHRATKGAAEGFRWTAKRPGFRYHLGVEVGRDITHQELTEHFHAVLYAHGASADRALGIPGEQLPGSHPATEFVGWYNGHPDHAEHTFDLSGERAVIIGNGNVALDVARILLADPAMLATTDIADHALEALRASTIREVVVLGRRGPAQAAYTSPELEALGRFDGVDVIIDPGEVQIGETELADLDPAARLKVRIAAELAARPRSGADRRVILRHFASPVEILGSTGVAGLRTVRNELRIGDDGMPYPEPTADVETLKTGVVLRSIGHRGVPIPGVPFHAGSGIIPNHDGRVMDVNGSALDGVYTAGWIKRGPSGVIGTNKKCAADTVGRLLEDARARRLPSPVHDRRSLEQLLQHRQPDRIDNHGWELIDRHERNAGARAARPRIKLVHAEQMLGVASTTERLGSQ